MRRAALVLLALALTGCVTRGPLATMPVIPDNEPAATIVVIRDFRFIASALTLALDLDGQDVYGIRVGEHVRLRVAPGTHVLTIRHPSPMSNNGSVSVVAAPGSVQYYQIETGMGLLQTDYMLQPVPPVVGEQLVEKTKRL